MLTVLPEDVELFRDDDDGFFGWLDGHQNGYFMNCERSPGPRYMVLHRPQCPHIKGGSQLHWTKDYVKICAVDRRELETWASETVGGEVTLCRSCFGG